MVLDLKCDGDGDLLIENGDFVIASSDDQHNLDIINANTGDYKEYPLVGFNAFKYLNGRTTPAILNQSAKIQLLADGCSKESLKIDLKIDANGKISGNVNGNRL